jgi:glycosyltransferase involved in cell wall biosynthesis
MTLPRKVLHVMNGATGGAARSTIGLIGALRGMGVDACAVCHDAGTEEDRAALREAVRGEVVSTPLYVWNRKIRAATWKRPLIELRQLMRTGAAVSSTARVAAAARRFRADFVHTNTILTPEGALAARLLGLPHVWHLRELLGPGAPFRLPVEGKALGWTLANLTDRVVANSEAAAARVETWLPPGLMAVVPNGIDVESFAGVPALERERKPVVVGLVASLSSRVKKHGLFLHAAALVPTATPVEFRIYGDDPDDDYSLSLRGLAAELSLGQRVVWRGFVADPRVIMGEIDVLCHVTEVESFGRVAIEAMAAARPVVAVRGGGLVEIVEDEATGLLVPPDDARAIAGAIARLVADRPFAARLGAAGKARAEQRFSLGACASGIARAYEGVLAERRV